MSNLVAFGCSITYGHGLPDCFSPPSGPGPTPSNLAWPSLLGKKLEKSMVVNNADPGASNLQILWKILNYKFQPEDMCVVHWSYFDRLDVVRLDLDSSTTHRLELEDFDKNFLSRPGYSNHNAIRNFLMIHHAALFLEDKGIPYFFLDRISLHAGNKFPEHLKPKGYDNTQFDQYFKIDLALDNAHPGIKSQEKIANYIHSKLTQEMKKN
jgi:hypothetical protein